MDAAETAGKTQKKRREGPFPLTVHIGMATARMAGVADYAARYIPPIAEADMVSMVRGIQMYQAHPYAPVRQELLCVREYDTVRILKPSGSEQNKGAPLLLVPSLVNGSDILDLMPERSFLRWIDGQGIPVYLLDWGDLTQSAKPLDIQDIVYGRLATAIRDLAEREGRAVNVLGYCMGGTLLLPAALACAEHIGKIVLLAAPWDFHAGHPELFERVRMWSPVVQPVIAQKGALPAQWTQALFASLDPADVVQKFSKFADMDQDSLEARLFVAVEDWLNDGRDLPGAVAQHCIREWFAQNATAKGIWRIGDAPVDPGEIGARVLVVASERDKLVRLECAANILPDLPKGRAEILRLSCGHVGFIAGKRAVAEVWEPIRNWLCDA